MTLVLTDWSKDILKKYEELWNNIKDLIRSISNDSDNTDNSDNKIYENKI